MIGSFPIQREAISTALTLIQKLPATSVWALEVTHDNDGENPGVLNIFAEESLWASLMLSLRLGKPVDRSTRETGEQFVSFRQGTLLISLIEQEER